MQNESIRVLIVTESPRRHDDVDAIITTAGFQTRVVSDSMSALGALEIWRPNVAVVDLRFPSREAHRFCADVAERPDADSLPLVLVAEGPNLLKSSTIVPAGLVASPIDPSSLVATVLRVARDTTGALGEPISAH